MSYQDPLLAYLPDGKQRKRRKKRADVKEGITHADARQKEYSVYQDWRDNSLTLQRIRSNAARFQQTCDAVKRGLQQAQNQIADQVDSSRDAVVVALKQQLKSARTKLRRALQQQQQQQEQKATEELCADLAACSKCVKGSKQDSQSFAIGSLLFGALAFVCGNVPGLLPSLYLAFAAVALPWRIHQFYCKRLTFYLLDFCYWANLATIAFMVFGSGNTKFGTMVYALADGPLAGALIVWQSAWVFGSAAHVVSVLIHLLPGLALFAWRHFPPPAAIAHIRVLNPVRHGANDNDSAGFWWFLVAPTVFYAAWQLIYWFIVQICCQQSIKKHGYETSYSCLAKRAAKSNNVWNRLVRRGCKARRICMFGAIQLVFTLGCLLVFIPLYHSFYLSCVWQVIKFAVPVYYGSRYQCEKVPQHQVVKAVQSKKVQISLIADAKSAMSPPKKANPL